MKQIYDMLKLENIKILAGVKDWKEAIYTAVQPLVDGAILRTLVIALSIQTCRIYCLKKKVDQ